MQRAAAGGEGQAADKEGPMATGDPSLSSLPPTVLKVINEFVAALRAADDVDEAAADRLERLLKQTSIPKPDDISAVLFDPPKGGVK